MVFGHVGMGVGGIAGGARGEGDEAGLLRRRRHVVEQVKQHPVGELLFLRTQQHLGKAQGDRHIAGKQRVGLLQRLARTADVTVGKLRLAQSGVVERHVGMAVAQVGQDDRGAAGIPAGHQGHRAAVAPFVARGQVDAGGVLVQVLVAAVGRQDLHPQPFAHQAIADAVSRVAPADLFCPVARLGDAFERHRVGAQQVRYVLAGAAGALLQGPEEIGHAGRVEAGADHDADADPVRLRLIRAREVDLLLRGESLRSRYGAQQHVGRHPGGGADQHSRQHRGGGKHAAAAGVLDGTRDMTLGDVGDLVGQHAGQLAFAAGGREQPGVDADESARQGEGVDAGIIDDKEREPMCALVRMAGEARTDRLQVFRDFRVLDDLAGFAQAPEDHAADLVFVVE